MRACEICGNPLTNPRAKTCSTKCRTIKHRRDKSRPVLDANESNSLSWFNENEPLAGRALNTLLANHGKEALLLAYTALNEHGKFLETYFLEAYGQSFAVEKAG